MRHHRFTLRKRIRTNRQFRGIKAPRSAQEHREWVSNGTQAGLGPIKHRPRT